MLLCGLRLGKMPQEARVFLRALGFLSLLAACAAESYQRLRISLSLLPKVHVLMHTGNRSTRAQYEYVTAIVNP